MVAQKDKKILSSQIGKQNCICGKFKNLSAFICSDCTKNEVCDCGCIQFKRVQVIHDREYSSLFPYLKYRGKDEFNSKIERVYTGSKDAVFLSQVEARNKIDHSKYEIRVRRNGNTNNECWMMIISPRQ